MRKIVIILTFLLLTSTIGQSFACSCIGQSTVQEEVKHADAVVVGTILKKQIIALANPELLELFPNDTAIQNEPMNKINIARYDFLVEAVYKGEITKDTLAIYTGIGNGDCGIRFETGKKYIVYGEAETYFGRVNNNFKFPKTKNTYWTYSCLRTTIYYQDEITEIEKFAKKTVQTKKNSTVYNEDKFSYVYTSHGGIRPKNDNFFSYKKQNFKLLDTLLIDTNSIYIKYIGDMYFPQDKYNGDFTSNAYLYFRFYSTGKLKYGLCDSFPTTQEVNDILSGGVGYFIKDSNKFKIQYIADNGKLIKKNVEVKNNELIIHEQIGKIELFKKTKIKGMTFEQPNW